MAKISDVEVGENNSCDHQNGGEISPGDLHCDGLCDPIGMDIFATRDKRHRICIHVSGESYSGGKMPCILFEKSKCLPPIVGALSTTAVKKYGLGLKYPVT